MYAADKMKQIERVKCCRTDDWLRESLGMLVQIKGAKKSRRFHHSIARSPQKDKAATKILKM